MPAETAESSERLIDRLQLASSRTLDSLIPIGSSVVLLDFPNHSNVGDSLIWLGEVAYLRRRQATILYVCECWSLDVDHLRRQLTPDTIILLHGGGNFGTLWPDHHAFRLNVVRQFPDHRIVQLPQSVHFSDEGSAAETVAVLEQHSRFTLLVRDQKSADVVEALSARPPIVSPDMAFFIGPVRAKSRPRSDFLVLSRTDHEKAEHWGRRGQQDLIRRGEELDWLKSGLKEMVIRTVSRSLGVHASAAASLGVAVNLAVWNALADSELRRGAELLGRGRVVVTDRLHAHILSVLLDKPHVVVDNACGKLTAYLETWSGNYENLRLASSRDEALETADAMIAR